MPHLFVPGQPTVFKQLPGHIWVTAVEHIGNVQTLVFGSRACKPARLWNVEWFMWQGSAQAPRSWDGNTLYRVALSPRVETLQDFARLCRWHGDLNVYNEEAKKNVLKRGCFEKPLKRIFFFILVAAKSLLLKFFPPFQPLRFFSLPRLSQECEAKNTNAVRTYNVLKWRVGGVDLSLYYDLITLWKEVSGATYYKCLHGRWHISEVLVMKVQRWCKYITRRLSLTRTVLQDLTQGPYQTACLVRARSRDPITYDNKAKVALKGCHKTDPRGFSECGKNN